MDKQLSKNTAVAGDLQALPNASGRAGSDTTAGTGRTSRVSGGLAWTMPERKAAKGPEGAPGGSDVGLYLHIPFCFHKCHYCDFYSVVSQLDRADEPKRHARFTDALIREMERSVSAEPFVPNTLFIGGGTPTLLHRDSWDRLLNALHTLGLVGPHTDEFTVEANPETVEPELLALLVEHGVTRLSIGAQTFQPRLLQALERWHDPANVGRAVTLARDAGVREVNLDLIFAIPGQTLAELEDDLDRLLGLEPDHVATYSLTYEPGTALTQKLRLGRVSAVGDEVELAMYRRCIERVSAAGVGDAGDSGDSGGGGGGGGSGDSGGGFEHYEVSNFARRVADGGSRRCRHNLVYWRNRPWLGFGPGAASHRDGRRWKNEPHLGRYCDAVLAGRPAPLCEDERLSPKARLGEWLMLGLRLREGVDRGELDRRLDALDDTRRRADIDAFIEQGLLEVTEAPRPRLRLSDAGLMVADGVTSRLL